MPAQPLLVRKGCEQAAMIPAQYVSPNLDWWVNGEQNPETFGYTVGDSLNVKVVLTNLDAVPIDFQLQVQLIDPDSFRPMNSSPWLIPVNGAYHFSLNPLEDKAVEVLLNPQQMALDAGINHPLPVILAVWAVNYAAQVLLAQRHTVLDAVTPPPPSSPEFNWTVKGILNPAAVSFTAGDSIPLQLKLKNNNPHSRRYQFQVYLMDMSSKALNPQPWLIPVDGFYDFTVLPGEERDIDYAVSPTQWAADIGLSFTLPIQLAVIVLDWDAGYSMAARTVELQAPAAPPPGPTDTLNQILPLMMLVMMMNMLMPMMGNK